MANLTFKINIVQKKYTLFLFSLLFCFHAIGQIKTFRKVFSQGLYTFGRSIVVDSDGSNLITGSVNLGGTFDSDLYLLKTDSNGNVVWNKTYIKPGIDWGICLKRIPSDGYIISGYTSRGAGGYDVLLMKIDSLGNEVWSKTFGGSDWDFGNSVDILPDGGFMVAGETYSYGQGNADMYLIRTNSSGDTLWTKTMGYTGEDRASCVKTTTDGHIVITGCISDTVSHYKRISLMKLDVQGVQIWNKLYGYTLDNEGMTVLQTANGGFIIGGYTSKADSTQKNAYVMRTDAQGDSLWSQYYQWNHDDAIHDIIENADGTLVYTGVMEGFGNSPDDMLIFKSDAAGNWLVGGSFGGASTEEGFGVKATPDGGFIAVGSTNSYGSSISSIYLVKTNQLLYAKDSIIYSTTDIKTYQKESPCMVYPNPFKEKTNIVLTEKSTNIHLELYDLMGRNLPVHWSRFVSQEKTILELYREDLPPGVYFYNIIVDNQIAQRGKIIAE